MAEQPASIPKKIIICCDGTWQSAVSGKKNSPSNVTRLARSLERVAEKDGKIWQQIVWYDSGVGTTSGWLGQKHEGAVGAGIEGNIIEAYNFVVLNWAPGDQVLCFGFSRGAYTARSIAGLISDIGICEPRQLGDFHEIWEAYKSNYQGERFHGSDPYFDYLDGVPADDKDQLDDYGWKNRDFKWKKPPRGNWEVCPESKNIEVVGVYDTVGALGFPDIHGYKLGWGPDKHGFHNVKLNPNIKHAFQALALDEHREAFSPTLWHLPEGKSKTDAKQGEQSNEERFAEQQQRIDEAYAAWYPKAYDKKVPIKDRQKLKTAYNQARRDLARMKEDSKKPSELLQVWFPGVHINIGGGSSDSLEDKGDLEEMAEITLSWMLDQINSYVSIRRTVIYQDACARQEHIRDLNDELRKYNLKVAQDQKDAAERSWGQWANHAIASAASSVRHPLTRPKKPNTERHDMGWGTGTIIDSYTLMYRLNGSKPRTPGAYAKDLKHTTPGTTNEEIHPTVGYRYKMFKKLANASGNNKLRYYPAGVTEEQGFERRQTTEGRWEYVFADGVVLPEYRIKPNESNEYPSFERHALAQAWDTRERDLDGKPLSRDTAAKYMRKLDVENGYNVEDMGELSEGSDDESQDKP